MVKRRIGILISGRGTNMRAIIEAVQSGRLENCEIGVVISDRERAAGLQIANEHGMCAVALPRDGRTREEHEGDFLNWLQTRKVDLVCLAGYLRLLSPRFIDKYRG